MSIHFACTAINNETILWLTVLFLFFSMCPDWWAILAEWVWLNPGRQLVNSRIDSNSNSKMFNCVYICSYRWYIVWNVFVIFHNITLYMYMCIGIGMAFDSANRCLSHFNLFYIHIVNHMKFNGWLELLKFSRLFRKQWIESKHQ